MEEKHTVILMLFIWRFPRSTTFCLGISTWLQDLKLKQLLISQLWRPDWFPKFVTLSCLFGAKKGCCLSETLVCVEDPKEMMMFRFRFPEVYGMVLPKLRANDQSCVN